VCGVILILLWIYSLGTTLADPKTQAKVNQDLKPFAALKDNIVEGYKSMLDVNANVIQPTQ